MCAQWDLLDVCGALCIFMILCNPKFFLRPAEYMNEKRKRRVGICGFFMIIVGFLICVFGLLLTIAGSTTIGSLTDSTTGIILLSFGVPCVFCGIPLFLLSFCVVVLVNIFFKKVENYKKLKNTKEEKEEKEEPVGIRKSIRITPGNLQFGVDMEEISPQNVAAELTSQMFDIDQPHVHNLEEKALHDSTTVDLGRSGDDDDDRTSSDSSHTSIV